MVTPIFDTTDTITKKNPLSSLLSGEIGQQWQNVLSGKTYMVQYLFQVQIVCMAGHTVHKCPDKPAPVFFFERNISWNIVIMIHHKDNRLDCILSSGRPHL